MAEALIPVDQAEKGQARTHNFMVTKEVKVLTADRLLSVVPKWL